MRLAIILALAAQLTVSTTWVSAEKQHSGKSGGGGGGGDTFPGAGKMEDWKASVPEFKAGVASMKAKKWDDAINHFRASLALYEFQPHAWIQIGRAIEEKDGNIADAEEAYRKAVKLDTQNWHAWKRLANTLYIQKHYREAREAAASAAALNPPPKERAQVDSLIQRIEAASRPSDSE